MKKFVVLVLSVALLAAIPGMAFALKGGVKPATRALFESDLVTTDPCTVVGEAFVRADGSAKIEFKVPEAVAEDTDFTATLLCDGVPVGEPMTLTILAGEDEFSQEYPAGTVDIDCTRPVVEITGPGFEATTGFCLAPVI